MNRFKKIHWITNFANGTPWYKKLYGNFVYFVSGVIIHSRKNTLSTKDYVRGKLLLRRGDIILWGNLRESSSLLIEEPVTHASLYMGRKRVLEAVGDGVRKSKLKHFFTEYDTMVILRVLKGTKLRLIWKAIKYAKKQIGKPYDWEFKKGPKSFFCTELVNESFKQAGYKTGIASVKKGKVANALGALHPARFVKGKFRVIFLSHNLKLKGKKLIYWSK